MKRLAYLLVLALTGCAYVIAPSVIIQENYEFWLAPYLEATPGLQEAHLAR